ncbi:MAG: hypothetical protein ACR2N4_12995 [Jatrophihabitans sp.]
MASQGLPSWEQVLADLESETTMLAEGLRRGELLAPVTPWHPPALPPIPTELVARAQLLLEQQLRLQVELGLQLQDAPPATRPRSVNRPDPVPMLVDLRA